MKSEFSINVENIQKGSPLWPIDKSLFQKNPNFQNIPSDYLLSEKEMFSIKNPFNFLFRTIDLLKKLNEKTISKRANIGENVSISGPVIIDDGVCIDNNVNIKGPVIIGKGTFVGVNSLIRNSIIGFESEIGANTDIGRSIVGSNCRCTGQYLKDSLLCNGVWLGGGVVVSNIRADEKTLLEIRDGEFIKAGAIIGKDTTVMSGSVIMPGVLIGSKCKIFPGTVVYNSIPNGTIMRVKQELQIIENASRFLNRR